MARKKKTPETLVTLVEDLYGITTAEISEAQNNPDVLNFSEDAEDAADESPEEVSEDSPEDLETESESELETEFEGDTETLGQLESLETEESEESIEAQLDRLAKAISDHAEEAETFIETPLENAEALLAQQIAEDQALAQEDAAIANLDSSSSQLVLDQEEIQSCVEAILFLSDKPVSTVKLREMLNPELNFSLFQAAMDELVRRYQAPDHGIEISEVAGGYQFRTKPSRADLAQKLIKIQTQRLSTGAMETLAIISYQQPVMKEEIDKIRGVDSSYFIRNLMDRKLIRISGRSELPGRPILYSTSPEFLEIFGLKDLGSLPPLRELEQMIPGSQSANPADEDPRVREMRRLVGEMKSDQSSALYYNPKEDDKILKEIREKVSAIPSSTPYLDELKAAETLAAKGPVAGPDQPPLETSGAELSPSSDAIGAEPPHS